MEFPSLLSAYLLVVAFFLAEVALFTLCWAPVTSGVFSTVSTGLLGLLTIRRLWGVAHLYFFDIFFWISDKNCVFKESVAIFEYGIFIKLERILSFSWKTLKNDLFFRRAPVKNIVLEDFRQF